MSSALTVNVPFEWQATATGGTPPYTWSATGLPTGISINSSTGLISGTPTAAGTFNATITVTDDNSDTANDTASFTVQGVPAASPHYAFVERAAALVRQWGVLIAAVPTTETMAGLTRQWAFIADPDGLTITSSAAAATSSVDAIRRTVDVAASAAAAMSAVESLRRGTVAVTASAAAATSSITEGNDSVEIAASAAAATSSVDATRRTVEVAASAAAATSAIEEGGVDLTANLIASWQFNDDLTDSSGNGITLTQFTGGTATYVTSTLDKAIDIGGTDANGLQAIDTALDSLHTSGFYFELVIYIDGFTSTNFPRLLTQFDNTISNDNEKFELFLDNGSTKDVSFVVQDSSGNNVADVELAALSTGTWHQIEGYFDPSVGSHGEIGLATNNGSFTTASLSAAMNTLTTATTPIVIGNIYDTDNANNIGELPFEGKIDHVRIWDTVWSDLSPTGPERAELWNSGNFNANP